MTCIAYKEDGNICGQAANIVDRPADTLLPAAEANELLAIYRQKYIECLSALNRSLEVLAAMSKKLGIGESA